MQTRLEAQKLLVGFQQDGYFVNTDMLYKDWQVELDKFRQELDNLSNSNQYVHSQVLTSTRIKSTLVQSGLYQSVQL
jgi:hypothetical protein